MIAGQANAKGTGVRTVPLSAPDATLTSEFTSLTSVRELADGRVLVVDVGENKLLIADWRRGTAVQLVGARHRFENIDTRLPTAIARRSTHLRPWSE